MKLKESDISYKCFDFDMANIIDRGVRDIKKQMKEDVNKFIDPEVFKYLGKLAILGNKIKFALQCRRAKIEISFQRTDKKKD